MNSGTHGNNGGCGFDISRANISCWRNDDNVFFEKQQLNGFCNRRKENAHKWQKLGYDLLLSNMQKSGLSHTTEY